MRLRFWAGLCAAAALALPAAALAQDKAPAAPTKDQIAKGKADAPALLQAAGAQCDITDAAYRGGGTSGGKKVDIYEAACSNGPGFLVIKTAGQPAPKAYPCLAVADQGTKCVLPANSNPTAQVAKLAAAAGRTCQVSNARYVGASTSSGETYYEVACASGPGFQLGVPSGANAKPQVVDCLALLGTSRACTLTDKTQALAALTPLVQASGRTCNVSDGRFVGTSDQTQSTYYEVACGASGGFMLATDNTSGKFKQAIDCGQATGIAGGCTLTSATVTAANDTARYTREAAAAGFPCQISKTRNIGQDTTGASVVEVACSNRPDGAIGIFPASGPARIYDCVRAGALKQQCELTSPAPVYAKYSAALAAKGRGSCKVSGARYLGDSKSTGGEVVETACSDGKPGWVIFFAPGKANPTVSQLLSCGQASGAGMACQLPTNLAGNKPG